MKLIRKIYILYILSRKKNLEIGDMGSKVGRKKERRKILKRDSLILSFISFTKEKVKVQEKDKDSTI